MLSRQRPCGSQRLSRGFGAHFVIAVSATLLAGCSADISRFGDSPMAGLSDQSPVPAEPIRRNAGGPVDPGVWPSSGPRDSDALPPPARQAFAPPPNQGVRIANLPSPPPAAAAIPTSAVPAKPAPVRAAVATNGTVDVLPGDTLYAIAKRHGVSIAALMDANALTSPNLKPGQKLALPAVSTQPKRPLTRPAETVAAIPAAKVAAPQPAVGAPVVAAAPTGPLPRWEGSYTVKPGDSLYAIAQAHKVKSAVLQQVNGITDPMKVRPGVTLKVPAGVGPAPLTMASTPANAPPRQATSPATSTEPPRVVASNAAAGSIAAPKIINATPTVEKPAEQRVAALGGMATDSPAAAPPAAGATATEPVTKPVQVAVVTPAAVAGTKFRWPAKGRIIGEFGGRPDGTHNDGVNIAVPAGTDVHAAEGGTVAYAGSELKGYGNLVLIRHDNGWVSAYAHADQVLVKRGDTIKRGQVIAKAGKTGTVDQPQVHFELRQGSKPVDPMPHLEKM